MYEHKKDDNLANSVEHLYKMGYHAFDRRNKFSNYNLDDVLYRAKDLSLWQKKLILRLWCSRNYIRGKSRARIYYIILSRLKGKSMKKIGMRYGISQTRIKQILNTEKRQYCGRITTPERYV